MQNEGILNYFLMLKHLKSPCLERFAEFWSLHVKKCSLISKLPLPSVAAVCRLSLHHAQAVPIQLNVQRSGHSRWMSIINTSSQLIVRGGFSVWFVQIQYRLKQIKIKLHWIGHNHFKDWQVKIDYRLGQCYKTFNFNLFNVFLLSVAKYNS